MGDGSSPTEDTKSAPVPLRLRVGVFLILLWIVPFWALAAYIAHSLSGAVTLHQLLMSRRSSSPCRPSSAARVLGRRTAVKSIIKGSTMGVPWGPSGPCSFTGTSEVRATSAIIRMKGDHHTRTPSCFAVADRLPYPDTVALRGFRPVFGRHPGDLLLRAPPKGRAPLADGE